MEITSIFAIAFLAAGGAAPRPANASRHYTYAGSRYALARPASTQPANTQQPVVIPVAAPFGAPFAAWPVALRPGFGFPCGALRPCAPPYVCIEDRPMWLFRSNPVASRCRQRPSQRLSGLGPGTQRPGFIPRIG